MDGYLRKRGYRLALLIVLILAALAGIYALREIFAPLLLAFLIAYVLDPFADALEGARVGPIRFNRAGAVVVIFAVFAVLAVVGLSAAGYYTYRGIDQLYHDVAVGERLHDSKSKAREASGQGPILEHREEIRTYYRDANGDEKRNIPEELGYSSRGDAEAAPGDGPIRIDRSPGPTRWYRDVDRDGRRDPSYIQAIQARLEDWQEYGFVQEIRDRYASELESEDGLLNPEQLRKAAKRVSALLAWRDRGDEPEEGGGGLGLLGLLSYLVLCPVYTFFFLLEIDPMIAGVRKRLPGRHRPRIERIFGKIDQTMSAFMRGRLIICVIKSVVAAGGLWLLGVDYAIPLGLGAGFLSLIPYVGVYLSLIPAVILCWLEYSSFMRLSLVIVLYGANEWVEGFILIPQILGKDIGLHPLAVIVAFLVFTKIFGFLGMLLSVPLAAIVKILAEEFVYPLVDEFAEEPEPPPQEQKGAAG